MSRIFICYRRDDAPGHAGRLRDTLAAQFGTAAIFRDIEAIGPGEDFVKAMSAAISSCPVFLAVIGTQWLSLAARDGTRRLDDEHDHVRSEIVEALQCGVRVIPVLVENAGMPRADDLPAPLAALASRNAIALDEDSWDADVQRLGDAIRGALQPPSQAGAVQRREARSESRAAGSTAVPAPILDRRHLLAAAAVVLAIAIAMWLQRERGRDEAIGSAVAPVKRQASQVPARGRSRAHGGDAICHAVACELA